MELTGELAKLKLKFFLFIMNKRKYREALQNELEENSQKRVSVQREAEQSLVQRTTVLPVPVIVMILSQVQGAREIAGLLKSIAVTLRIAREKAMREGNRAEAERIAEQRRILWSRISFEYFPWLEETEIKNYSNKTDILEEIIPALISLPDDLEVNVATTGFMEPWNGELTREEKDQIRLADYRSPFEIARKSSVQKHFDIDSVEKLVAQRKPDYDKEKFKAFKNAYEKAELIALRNISTVSVFAFPLFLSKKSMMFGRGAFVSEETPFNEKSDGEALYPSFLSVSDKLFVTVSEEVAVQMFLNDRISFYDAVDLFDDDVTFDYSLKVSIDLRKLSYDEAMEFVAYSKFKNFLWDAFENSDD